MKEQIKTLIDWRKLRGQQETDPFVKFFFFYICLDAWLTAESGEDRDIDKINWFLNNANCLKEKWKDIQSSQTKGWLNKLKIFSPVEDMRPNHKGEFRELKNIENIEEVIRFIYQIRCNLFHGSKDLMNARDRDLVRLSGQILGKWIRWARIKC